jgi:high-affinity iron transporter
MQYASKFIVATVFLILVSSTFGTSFAQSNDDAILSAIEVTKAGLELTKTSMENGNIMEAAKYSKFTTDFFGKQVQIMRSFDASLADEIHILLLDIHTEITKSQTSATLTKISTVNNLINRIVIEPRNTENMIASMLLVADEKYQEGIQNNDVYSYQIAKSLIANAQYHFESNTNLDERLRLEIESFFAELIQKVENKENFVTAGTLITAIQRDLLGTETTQYDHQELFNKIRSLYSELLVALDSGNYQKAEELAIEAYLENFEYLEPQIEVVDANLLYTIEIDMREELRDMIIKRQDPQTIRNFLDESILPDLEKAENLIKEHFISNPSLDASAFPDKELKEIGAATEEQKSGVRSEIDFIRDTLEAMLGYYEQGDYQSAYAAARTAYLDSYEFVEIPLREIDPDFTLDVEFQFAELRNLIKEQADFEKVQEATVAIRRNLDESERLVGGVGTVAPTIAFSSSFAIIFREGLESVLILGAIITYLEASRNTKFKPFVYYGIIAAIGATAVTWFVASYIVVMSGASRELIEAIAALSATAVLFYVSFWVLSKIEHKKWMEFVKAKVWQATTTGSVMVFVMLSFFTVYREGFETVLFYQAMYGFAKYMEIYVGLGFVLGLGSLLGVYYGIRRLGRKLPLRALFGLTMGTGAYLSIAFLGNAIRELQTLDIVSYTSMLGIIPRLDITVATMTGIYPTLETLVSQIILLSVYLTASTYVLILRPRKEKQIAMMRKSRKIDYEQQATS